MPEHSQPHQHQHQHPTHDAAQHAPSHEDALAELLELDAGLTAPLLDEVVGWTARHVRGAPRTVADVGAGPGAGSRALARRFPAAGILAIDRSEVMLERLRTAAHGSGPADRIRTVAADLDAGWPAVGGVDLAWASSSLHELADPDRVLRELRTALAPGGLLVVVELDAPPRFLPDDGTGRPGLETRCHEALARAGWNAHPDWRPFLERAGFHVLEQRRFALEASPAPPGTGRYAHAWLHRARPALAERLDAADLAALDRLLADDARDGVLHRGDLVLRAGRTAWAARRP